MTLLHFAARHGRLCLISGLVIGFAFPALAIAMKPLLPAGVALLVFVAAFRVGARAALGSLRALPDALGTVFTLQVLLPMTALALCLAFGVATEPLAMAAVLMLAAPSISGSPNLTILVGHDPAPALRLMILGTALFPLTVLPVLWLFPGLDSAETARAGGLLLLTIAGATLTAFTLRRALPWSRTPEATEALDGLGAILMGVIVIGLLAGLSPLLRTDPDTATLWLIAAFALNFGLQVSAHALIRRRADRVPKSIIAGNRNIALFLVALPVTTTDPILPFIGAYQLPMYLTPILLAPLYRASDATLSDRER